MNRVLLAFFAVSFGFFRQFHFAQPTKTSSGFGESRADIQQPNLASLFLCVIIFVRFCYLWTTAMNLWEARRRQTLPAGLNLF